MTTPELQAELTDGLPEGWFVRHYPGRQQPFTVGRWLHYPARSQKSTFAHQTWGFCTSLEQAKRWAWLGSGEAKPRWTKYGQHRGPSR